jgi:hypothetical protein
MQILKYHGLTLNRKQAQVVMEMQSDLKTKDCLAKGEYYIYNAYVNI